MKFPRGGVVASGGKPEKPPGFLKLDPQRKVLYDPRKLGDFPLWKHESYRRQYAYVVFICREVEGKWKPIDARIVKTYPTLNKVAEVQKEGLRVLLHPQPVSIPSGFWTRWKKAQSGKERLDLAKGLTKDENIFALTCVVLDWDSPYEECEPAFLKLVEKLGIRGYECGRTKSGNFRAVIYLEPLRIEKENQPIKTFYLRPHTEGRNGHTHIQNFREIVAILNAYARKRGLKADDSFKRVNHPVWYGEGFYFRVRKVHGETKLYTLYNAVKKLQAEEGLWEVNREFWEYRKKKTNGKVVVPPFIAKLQAQKLDDLYRWQIAVKKLAEKYTSYRFCRVILPAVSWALDLNLPRSDVDDFLRELLPDKKNLEEDLEKAWKYARPLRFEWSEGKPPTLKEKLVAFLEATEEGASRQSLLGKIFGGQNWMLQMVERFALREGLIELEKVKLTPGPGRKAYVYILTEKGRSYLKALRDKAQSVQLPLAVGLGLEMGVLVKNPDKKSIYKTPPFRGEQYNGLVVDGEQRSGKTHPSSRSLPPSPPSPPEGSLPSSPSREVFLKEKLQASQSLLSKKVFKSKKEAVEFLESLNSKYRVGDRVRVWVKVPEKEKGPALFDSPPVIYEFEKVKKRVYRGGERETWELRTIYWNTHICPERSGGQTPPRRGVAGGRVEGDEGGEDPPPSQKLPN